MIAIAKVTLIIGFFAVLFYVWFAEIKFFFQQKWGKKEQKGMIVVNNELKSYNINRVKIDYTSKAQVVVDSEIEGANEVNDIPKGMRLLAAFKKLNNKSN